VQHAGYYLILSHPVSRVLSPVLTLTERKRKSAYRETERKGKSAYRETESLREEKEKCLLSLPVSPAGYSLLCKR
jgi:hypothetical protein